MPINLYPICWRERTDCDPLHCIDGVDSSVTQEQLMEMDYTPNSFVCVGCVNEENRIIPQDAYRLCFKNSASDEMTDNDVQDLTHIMAVISQALAVDATRRINGGVIEVPTKQVNKG